MQPDVNRNRREVRERIVETEGRFDLTIEIHPLSRSEIDRDELRTKTLLAGHVPAPTTERTSPPAPSVCAGARRSSPCLRTRNVMSSWLRWGRARDPRSARARDSVGELG